MKDSNKSEIISEDHITGKFTFVYNFLDQEFEATITFRALEGSISVLPVFRQILPPALWLVYTRLYQSLNENYQPILSTESGTCVNTGGEML